MEYTVICACSKQTTGVCRGMQRQTFSYDLMSGPPKCCICLDEFTSPASLPCGHCFCLGCIGEYWRIHGACQCPLCKAIFPTRPQLRTDQTLRADAPTEEAAAPLKAGEVPCDFCPRKHRAVKSCLDCMASYCAAHLEPHYQHEALGRHLLISVVKNLEGSVCRLHGKQLNRFCRSDQTCICATCAQTDHRRHHIISINREAIKKKVKSNKSTTTGNIILPLIDKDLLNFGICDSFKVAGCRFIIDYRTFKRRHPTNEKLNPTLKYSVC